MKERCIRFLDEFTVTMNEFAAKITVFIGRGRGQRQVGQVLFQDEVVRCQWIGTAIVGIDSNFEGLIRQLSQLHNAE